MKFGKEVGWVKAKINLALKEMTDGADALDSEIKAMTSRMSILQGMPNTEKEQQAYFQLEQYQSREYSLRLNIIVLKKILEAISDKPDDEIIEVDTGDDRLWVLSGVNS